ncbi:hypothetical protein [Paraburkholderia franconis]|uniref:hypothetical protein n=1 Tax=Paraburkholderia franconis TaxID=2654983 RepID=UPI00187B8962|nr:hypothetical protein [Paraburkholderia franconis]
MATRGFRPIGQGRAEQRVVFIKEDGVECFFDKSHASDALAESIGYAANPLQ